MPTIELSGVRYLVQDHIATWLSPGGATYTGDLDIRVGTPSIQEHLIDQLDTFSGGRVKGKVELFFPGRYSSDQAKTWTIQDMEIDGDLAINNAYRTHILLERVRVSGHVQLFADDAKFMLRQCVIRRGVRISCRGGLPRIVFEGGHLMDQFEMSGEFSALELRDLSFEGTLMWHHAQFQAIHCSDFLMAQGIRTHLGGSSPIFFPVRW